MSNWNVGLGSFSSLGAEDDPPPVVPPPALWTVIACVFRSVDIISHVGAPCGVENSQSGAEHVRGGGGAIALACHVTRRLLDITISWEQKCSEINIKWDTYWFGVNFIQELTTIMHYFFLRYGLLWDPANGTETCYSAWSLLGTCGFLEEFCGVLSRKREEQI